MGSVPVVQPRCTNRAAKGRWYMRLSPSVRPRRYTAMTRSIHAAARTAIAAQAAHRVKRPSLACGSGRPPAASPARAGSASSPSAPSGSGTGSGTGSRGRPRSPPGPAVGIERHGRRHQHQRDRPRGEQADRPEDQRGEDDQRHRADGGGDGGGRRAGRLRGQPAPQPVPRHRRGPHLHGQHEPAHHPFPPAHVLITFRSDGRRRTDPPGPARPIPSRRAGRCRRRWSSTRCPRRGSRRRPRGARR